MTMSTIVFIDTRGEKLPKAAQEAVTYASKLAGGPVTAVTFGGASGLEALGAQGASKVIVARGVTAVDGQQLTKLVTDWRPRKVPRPSCSCTTAPARAWRRV
jgi:electron transfer flavoprotein alpha subunit